jgi:hypothetical protein
MFTYPFPHLQVNDIIRHPASGTTGLLTKRGLYTADFQTSDGTMYYVRLDELIPADYAEEAEFDINLRIVEEAVSGDIVRVAPDDAYALVVRREGAYAYVMGLYDTARAGVPVYGRDYWLQWLHVE